jgi:hypothetical protein
MVGDAAASDVTEDVMEAVAASVEVVCGREACRLKRARVG